MAPIEIGIRRKISFLVPLNDNWVTVVGIAHNC